MPERVQRSRQKGWHMPPDTISVTRPSRWGNPFQGPDAADAYRRYLDGQMSVAEWASRRDGKYPFYEPGKLRAEAVQLRGANLACWCKAGQPCHADVLLEVANGAEDYLNRIQVTKAEAEGQGRGGGHA